MYGDNCINIGIQSIDAYTYILFLISACISANCCGLSFCRSGSRLLMALGFRACSGCVGISAVGVSGSHSNKSEGVHHAASHIVLICFVESLI